MAKAYKYRCGIGLFDEKNKSIFERDVDTLTNNQIYLPTIDHLNDPAEGFYNDSELISCFKGNTKIQSQYEELVKKFHNIGIYSLSKTNDNELLWAYYASGHTGFAIEYDIDILKESLNFNPYFRLMHDFDVDYVDSVPAINLSLLKDANDLDILKICVGTKSKSWMHENELRLIFEMTGLANIDYRSITGIYFGYKMDEREKISIMEKLKGRGVAYYKMDLIENTYKFIPKPIQDKFSDAPKYVPNSIQYDVDELMSMGYLSEEEKIQYRDIFIDALESIKTEPFIKCFYQVAILPDAHKIKIFAYTTTGITSIRQFVFNVYPDGHTTRIQ